MSFSAFNTLIYSNTVVRFWETWQTSQLKRTQVTNQKLRALVTQPERQVEWMY